MPKFVIKLGSVNKKLFLPFLYVILYSFIEIYDNHIDPVNSDEYEIVILYLHDFGISFSEIIMFFISKALKYKSRYKTIKIIKKRNYIKDFLLLFLFSSLFLISSLSPFYIKKMKEKYNDTYTELYINDAIELITITLATYILLKNKYYIHHIVSIIVIIFLCLINDLILDNFTNTNIYIVISSLILILTDSCYYSYCKYLIDYKYYNFLDLWYIIGTFTFTSNFISLIIIIMIHRLNNSYKIFFHFYNFYIEKGVLYMIYRFFFGFIFKGFLVDFLELLMLDKLSPNYIIIGFELGRIPSILIEAHGSKRYLFLIISLFQIMMSLFYLEILEFNFCSLNINTRKNIREREIIQSAEDYYNDDDRYESVIVIDGYILSETIKSIDKEIIGKMVEREESFDK